MADIFLNNIYLIVLLPLWIFLIIMLGRFFSVYVNKIIIYALTSLSSLIGAFLSGGALLKLPADRILETGAPFIKINDFIINYGLHVDKTALVFAFVLFSVSFLIQMFSISYMKNEVKQYRFFALLNLFNFSMSGLFFSPNLFQMYAFWELAGVASYLLIGFDYSSFIKSQASKRVFIMNRIGDTAFIGAIILCTYFIYTYAPNKNLTTLSFVDFNTISTLVYAYTSSELFWLICILFVIATAVKSAQFPFYTWLQDAMEAKLPVSALLHSATLVSLGIFLTLRLLPFLTFEPLLLKLVALIGLVTAFICSISACSQINPKKALAYSTSAQLGIIYIAIGLMNIRAAIALFVAHAYIKSMLFITLPQNNDRPWELIKFIAFLLGGLSLSGLLLSGMIAKEMFATTLGNTGTIIFSVLSFLTAFYIIRIALVLYQEYGSEKLKINFFELLSILGFVGFNILFYIYLHKTAQYKIAEPFWAALTAWICVYILYINDGFRKIPLLYPISFNGFYLENINNLVSNAYTKLANISEKIDTKFFSNYKPITRIAKLGVKFANLIEFYIFDGTVRFITKLCRKISLFDKKSQTGNIQSYNTYAFIIITIIFTILVLGYSAIIIHFGGAY